MIGPQDATARWNTSSPSQMGLRIAEPKADLHRY